jgi:hypothetical protein
MMSASRTPMAMQSSRRGWLALPLRADRNQILNDRGGQHARGQRPAVCVQAEHDHVATFERFAQIYRLSRGPRVEPVPSCRSRRASPAGRASRRDRVLARGQRPEVVKECRGLGGREVAGE